MLPLKWSLRRYHKWHLINSWCPYMSSMFYLQLGMTRKITRIITIHLRGDSQTLLQLITSSNHITTSITNWKIPFDVYNKTSLMRKHGINSSNFKRAMFRTSKCDLELTELVKTSTPVCFNHCHPSLTFYQHFPFPLILCCKNNQKLIFISKQCITTNVIG